MGCYVLLIQSGLLQKPLTAWMSLYHLWRQPPQCQHPACCRHTCCTVAWSTSMRSAHKSPPKAHWPTKENRQNFCIFFDFSGPRKKLPGVAPNGAGGFFFWLIQTLSTFWATRILILRIFIFWDFLGSQISRFPDRWARL